MNPICQQAPASPSLEGEGPGGERPSHAPTPAEALRAFLGLGIWSPSSSTGVAEVDARGALEDDSAVGTLRTGKGGYISLTI